MNKTCDKFMLRDMQGETQSSVKVEDSLTFSFRNNNLMYFH